MRAYQPEIDDKGRALIMEANLYGTWGARAMQSNLCLISITAKRKKT